MFLLHMSRLFETLQLNFALFRLKWVHFVWGTVLGKVFLPCRFILFMLFLSHVSNHLTGMIWINTKKHFLKWWFHVWSRENQTRAICSNVRTCWSLIRSCGSPDTKNYHQAIIVSSIICDCCMLWNCDVIIWSSVQCAQIIACGICCVM